MSDEQKPVLTPWVCPFRAGSQMRTPVTDDPVPTVGSCVKDSCMLWTRRGASQSCAFTHMSNSLVLIDDSLGIIALHIGEHS